MDRRELLKRISIDPSVCFGKPEAIAMTTCGATPCMAHDMIHATLCDVARRRHPRQPLARFSPEHPTEAFAFLPETQPNARWNSGVGRDFTNQSPTLMNHATQLARKRLFLFRLDHAGVPLLQFRQLGVNGMTVAAIPLAAPQEAISRSFLYPPGRWLS